MNQLRKEVHEYIVASETLLSPVLLDEPLTLEELALVKYYAASLSEHGFTAPFRAAEGTELSCSPVPVTLPNGSVGTSKTAHTRDGGKSEEGPLV